MEPPLFPIVFWCNAREAGLIGAVSLFKFRRIKHLIVAAITELVLRRALPFNLTASVIRNSRRLPDRRIAARASRQGLGERDDEAPSNCCDRVGDVPFGSDRRRLWVVTVGNGRSRERRGEMWSRGGDGASFGDQKAVGGNTEGGMAFFAEYHLQSRL